MIATTRPEMSVSEPTLSVAFEVGKKEWQLAMTSGFGVDPWVRTVVSGDLPAVAGALRQGRMRFALPAQARVVSCYEAGRDGFWIHRALTQLGLDNRVVDSASIEVNRRARRAKTDRLDALNLVRMLVRVCAGERKVWSEVRVPTVAVEVARHVSRERTALRQEQTRLSNQLRGWLATWGCRLPRYRKPGWWTAVRDWAGAPLPLEVQTRLARAEARWAVLERQRTELEAQQQAAVTAGESVAPVGAIKGRRDDERVGVAGRRPGVAGVPQSAPDRRALGLCADPVRQRGVGAGARDQSGGQRAPAIDQHSAGVELGALATAERADAVVSSAIRHRETRASAGDCGGRA